ncbi:TPA: hypothetical protein N2D23_000922 [Pseudomonas aeruginosa]|nr:hypothetical protein [Pseudomonas aeruginosa]
MTESKICTCPSGDGSLRHPCPAHPAVEQAGGDERAAFNRWIAEQQLCQGSDISLFKLERNGALVSLHELLRDAYQAGQDRAALAQPSPAQADEKPGDSILCYGCFAKGVGPDHFDEAGKCLAAQGEQAEPKSGLEGWRDAIRQLAEQEEAVGCQGTNCGTTTGDHSPECLAEAAASQGWELKPEDLGEVEVVAYLATAEHPKHGQPHKAINYFKDPHDAQVAHWRERGCTVTEDQLMTVSQHASSVALWADLFNRVQRERDAALARVEQQERTIAGMNEAHAKLAGLYETAQAQHSGPEGWKPVPIEPLLNMMSDKDHDTRIMAERQLLSILAAAPGKEVGHE